MQKYGVTWAITLMMNYWIKGQDDITVKNIEVLDFETETWKAPKAHFRVWYIKNHQPEQ